MKLKRFLVLLLLLLISATTTLAHSGGTDGQGGHYDHSTGEYHFHHGEGPHEHPNGICPYGAEHTAEAPSSKEASGALAISIIFAVVIACIYILTNFKKISGWWRKHQYRNTVSGFIIRIMKGIGIGIYWTFKIITHALPALMFIFVIMGIPILYIGFVWEAWTEHSWIMLGILILIGALSLYAITARITVRVKEKIQHKKENKSE